MSLKHKLFSVIVSLSIFVSACTSIDASNAPVPEMPEIPVAVEADIPPAADQPLFGDEIYNAIEQCQSVGLNQACHNGEISDLSAGQTIRAESASLNSYDIWLARLQAPGVDSDFESLLILAGGNVEMRFDEIFIGRDETNQNLPCLAFSTADGADFSSGLIIINESEEDLLSLEANGVGLTLGSTSVVTSQPNGEMNVRMLTGSVAVSANEETIDASAGEKVTVPMTAEAKPSGPLIVGKLEDDLLTPLVPPRKPADNIEDDLLTPLVSPDYFANDYLKKFESAYNRCLTGDARQVYRAQYFTRKIFDEQSVVSAAVRRILGEPKLQEIREKFKNCATFELILTGSQQGSSSLSWTSKVSGDVMKLQFDHNGKLIAPVEGELTVTEFLPDMPLPPGCSSTAEMANSTLRVQEFSTLKIYYNTMRIRLYFWPNPVTEKLIMNCTSAPPVELPLDWNTYFWYLHPDLLREENQSYLVQDWEYTGGEIYAEAFYLGRSGTIEDGTVTSDTAFTLMHTPQK